MIIKEIDVKGIMTKSNLPVADFFVVIVSYVLYAGIRKQEGWKQAPDYSIQTKNGAFA